MWIVCITSVRHVLTVNGYGGRQTKVNEKRQCFKGWETLVNTLFSILRLKYHCIYSRYQLVYFLVVSQLSRLCLYFDIVYIICIVLVFLCIL